MTDGGLTQRDIAALTEARLSLGRRDSAIDTAASLRFSLDHAMAREAVLSEIDSVAITQSLERAGLSAIGVTSAAENRNTFIRRPDLGRCLPEADAVRLRGLPASDVAIVLGDGLSAIAVALNGAAFVSALCERLKHRGLTVGPIILARQARVALGDQIAQQMKTRTVVVALGERPGLTAADSLGVYVTHDAVPGTPDSARNCISNIREAGTAVKDAAEQTERLILAMRDTGLSGVALSQAIATGHLPNLATNRIPPE